jgi:2-amino-4-hydroxy-6-hydroxymethyldihydropteridine diphosphokinase
MWVCAEDRTINYSAFSIYGVEKMEVGFSLGSNLGDRLQFLQQARARLLAVPEVQLLACAPVYETAPVGVRPEHADKLYLNTIIVLEGALSAREWLSVIGQIEAELGRMRTEDRNAPRPVDIDIIYAGDQLIDQPDLEVPHPRWAGRRFVVQPLADIRSELVMPGNHKTVQEILENLPPEEAVRVFANAW